MMVKNDYTDVTMKCSVWQKDMDVIGAFAKKIGVPTPLFTATAAGLCRRAQAAATARTTPPRSARCWRRKAERQARQEGRPPMSASIFDAAAI